MGFFSGLVGGYADTMLNKEKVSQEKDREDKRARIQVLQHALDSGKLTPEAQQAAWEQLEELTSGKKGKGKGKGGFSISEMMGRLTGHHKSPEFGAIEGVPDGSKQPSGKGGDAGTSTPRIPAGSSDLLFRGKTSDQPFPPVRGDAGKPSTGVSLGQAPQPPQRARTFKTQAELDQEAVDAQTRSLEAQRALNKKWRAEDAQAATEAMNKAKTPEEKAIVEAEYGIKMPVQHLQYATVKMPDGSIRPAAFDPQTGQFLEPGTNLALEGAVKYVKPTTPEQKKDGLINSYMEATGASRQEAEKWYAKQDVRIEEAKGAPQTSTSTVVESTPEGPAVTRETITTRGPLTDKERKGVGQLIQHEKSQSAPTSSGPTVDKGIDKDGRVVSSVSITRPSQISLPWAIPQEGRTAIAKATHDYELSKARSETMHELLEKIKKDPKSAGQADKGILFNHLAMLRGANTSIRPTQLMMREAEKARTIPEGIAVTYEGNVVSGASLSPNQRKYMVDLADLQMRSQQRILLDEQVRYGVKVHVVSKDGQKGYVDKTEFKAHPEMYSEIQ